MISRKKLGQFFTKQVIADLMVKWVTENSPSKILDPAVGLGVFLNTVDSISPNTQKFGYEIDSVILEEYYKKNTFKATIYNEDYLNDFNRNKYDAIICNPPYNKFQCIQDRKKYIDNFYKQYNIKLSGYTNQCIYFLVKSINELTSNGRCCYIIPYEFLNNGYGKIIKDLFIDKKIVHTILKVNSSIALFDNVITTSCIIFIENTIHSGINFLNVDDINQLENFNLKDAISSYQNHFYNYSQLNSNDKWNNYFTGSCEINKTNALIPFKEISTVKRGIATGNNNYFTLNKSKIIEFGLSDNVCLPCITKSPDIENLVFTKDVFNKLVDSNKKMYLFDGTKSLTKSDFDYIELGEREKYHESYLTSHRKPWYSIENKDPAPILVSVFCRNKIKILRNEMMIKNLTTFHGIHFKKSMSEDEINIIFCYLLTPLAQEILLKNKREYGNNLDKFEPNDLNNAYVININAIDMYWRKKILEIYQKLKYVDYDKQSIEELNGIFSNIIYNN